MKRVYKYATGDAIPEGARHIATATQTRIQTQERTVTDVGIGSPTEGITHNIPPRWIDCWLVWHYYEVEV